MEPDCRSTRAWRLHRAAISRRHAIAAVAIAAVPGLGCAGPAERSDDPAMADTALIAAEIRTAVRAFHAADTARDAEAVIDLLWPDFTMLVDGSRTSYDEVATGSREFMAGLQVFHTEWTDIQVIPMGADVAVASFRFRDSILTNAGELIRSRGPTTFVWERRNGEWRLRFADADHYPIAEAGEPPEPERQGDDDP